MASPISFGGLASGLDTKSIIEQLISLESRPINTLIRNRKTIQSKVDAYKDLNTKMAALEDKAFGLTQISSIVGRSASSANTSALSATANSSAAIGTFQVEILKLAKASKLQTGTAVGQGNDNGGLANITDFSLETLTQINTNNRLKGELTEGTFFVNGQQILVTSGKTMTDIFNDISTATGGTVTGALVLDPVKGGHVVQLSSGSAITISNGTSSFLSLTKLDTAVYGAGTLTSTDAVNGVRNDLKLDGSAGAVNLAQTVTSGTMTINGVGIAYNAATDTLNDIIARINTASAGVTASFSGAGGGKVILTNQGTGPLAINVTDSGDLANALGLMTVSGQTLGQSAEIKVDGGPSQFFNTNSGISPAGITGITLDLKDDDPGNPIFVTVSAATDAAVSKVKDFISQYNSLVSKIRDLTKYDKTTEEAGLLLGDSSISAIQQRLFGILTSSVSGLSEGTTTTGNMIDLGINTGAVGSEPGTTNDLQLNESKLIEALKNTPTRVAQIFGASTTTNGAKGIFTQFKAYLDGYSNATGIFAQRQKVGNQQIADIDKRVTELNRRLETKRAFLEAQFSNMEKALAQSQSQQSALAGLFNQQNN